MPFIQRNPAGEIVGQFANLQPGFAEEYLPSDGPELLFVSPTRQASEERSWRDGSLAAVMWIRERHRDQVEYGGAITLLPAQFQELLGYMQALRDWPQSEAFPDSAQRPIAPPWIADQSQ